MKERSALEKSQLQNFTLLAASKIVFKRLVETAQVISPLGELVDMSSGKLLTSSKMNDSLPYPVYGGGGLTGYYSDYLFEDSQLAIGRVVARCGCVFATEPKSWITDNALYITRIADSLDKGYLFWALTNLNLRQQANHSAQPVVSQKTISPQLIPIPQNQIQRQIDNFLQIIERRSKGNLTKKIPNLPAPLADVTITVMRVEELVGKIAEARGLMERSIRECDNLSRSILFHCKSQSKITQMSDLVYLRKQDVSVSPEQIYHFAGVYSFGRGLFRQVSQKGMNFSYQKLTRIKTGNFVYPKLMAWEGALGTVPSELDECVVSPEFPVFEVNEDKILPEVLDTYFRTPSVWEDLAQASTGTNARRRRLHPSNFLRIEIPVPPMKIQLQLRALKQKVQVGNKIRQESLKELDALLPAILDKAFKGEL